MYLCIYSNCICVFIQFVFVYLCIIIAEFGAVSEAAAAQVATLSSPPQFEAYISHCVFVWESPPQFEAYISHSVFVCVFVWESPPQFEAYISHCVFVWES